jgi:hypothetical protein
MQIGADLKNVIPLKTNNLRRKKYRIFKIYLDKNSFGVILK